jgi:hypothetical protein
MQLSEIHMSKRVVVYDKTSFDISSKFPTKNFTQNVK